MPKEKDWARFAADYEERIAYVVGKADLDKIGEKLAEQENLGKSLEIGCGTGIYTKILANKSTVVTATDISIEMVNTASAQLHHRTCITFEQANCFKLPYDKSTFDTVFMANLLHVVAEPEKVILEARRVLKPGGRIIAASLTTHGMRFIDKMRMGFRYFVTWGKPPAKGTILTVPKLKQMLEKCGFTEIEGTLLGERSKAVFILGRAM